MKKSIFFLLALSGCVRLNYVDIPAEPSYKFRYVGEDAVVKCAKLAGRMCEKDGKTLANGSQIINIGEGIFTLNVFIDGNIVFREGYISGEGFFDRKIELGNGYNKTYTFDELDNTRIVSRCNGKFYKNLQEFEKLTDGTNSCDFLKEEDNKQDNDVGTSKYLSCNAWKTSFKISGSDYEYAEKLVGGNLDCKKLGDLIANHYDSTGGEKITVGILQQIVKDYDGIITKKILEPRGNQ